MKDPAAKLDLDTTRSLHVVARRRQPSTKWCVVQLDVGARRKRDIGEIESEIDGTAQYVQELGK